MQVITQEAMKDRRLTKSGTTSGRTYTTQPIHSSYSTQTGIQNDAFIIATFVKFSAFVYL
jgi:hypothetical protein